MAKKMKKLEKECQSWKTRFDGCNKSLIDMVADVSQHLNVTIEQRPTQNCSYWFVVCVLQKAIKEKEFELVTVKNQKLENLCRALQEERKSLYEKVQGTAGQSGITTAEPTVKVQEEVTEVKESHKDVEDHQPPVQETKAPADSSPLTHELAKLKAEQARLQEIAGSFTISHVTPTETEGSQSQGHSAGNHQPQQNHTEQSSCERVQESKDDKYQEQRDLEMESVD